MLAKALKKLFKADNEIRNIGTRHGEKLYETLLTREEMARAEDMGDYYRIPADIRDLNYACYFTEGETKVAGHEDYHSHNTRQLDEDGLIELLLKLDFVRATLATGKIAM
jgi:UDP-glucose 4-epimerase